MRYRTLNPIASPDSEPLAIDSLSSGFLSIRFDMEYCLRENV